MEIQEHYRKLVELRDSYSDEIPDEVLHSVGNPKYKCRKGGWFTGVINKTYLANMDGFLSEESQRECEKFYEYCKILQGKPLIEREDIEKGNRLLDFVIRDLESKISDSANISR